MAKLKAGSTSGGYRIVTSPSQEDVIPAIDKKYNLGSPGMSWREGWFDGVNIAADSLHIYSGSAENRFQWQAKLSFNNNRLSFTMPNTTSSFASHSITFKDGMQENQKIVVRNQTFYAYENPQDVTGSVACTYIHFPSQSVNPFDTIMNHRGKFMASTGSGLLDYYEMISASAHITFNTGSTSADFVGAAQNFVEACNYYTVLSGSSSNTDGFNYTASLDSFDSNQAVVKLQSLYTGSSENMNVWSYGNIINTFSGSAIYTNHLSTSMDYGGTDNHYGQNRAFATGSGTTAKSSSVDVASNFTDVFNNYANNNSNYPLTASTYTDGNGYGVTLFQATQMGSSHNAYSAHIFSSTGKIATNVSQKSGINQTNYFKDGKDVLGSPQFEVKDTDSKNIFVVSQDSGSVIGEETTDKPYWSFTQDGRIQFSKAGTDNVTEVDFRDDQIRVQKRVKTRAADDQVSSMLGNAFGSGSANNDVPLSLFKSDNQVSPVLHLENTKTGTNTPNADAYIYFKGNAAEPWSSGLWNEDGTFRITNHNYVGSSVKDILVLHPSPDMKFEVRNAAILAPTVSASSNLYAGNDVVIDNDIVFNNTSLTAGGRIYSANNSGGYLDFQTRGATFVDDISTTTGAPLKAQQDGTGPITMFYSGSTLVNQIDNDGIMSTNPGTIIGMTALNPDPPVSQSLTTSWDYIDYNNGYIVFTAPATGNVIIEFQGFLDTTHNRTGHCYLRLTDSSGTSIHNKYENIVDNSDESDDVTIRHQWLVTGLTSNSVYRYYIQSKTNATGNGYKRFKWGGHTSEEFPQLIIKSTTAPANINVG